MYWCEVAESMEEKKEYATSTCEATNNLVSSPHQLLGKYNFSLHTGDIANWANLIHFPNESFLVLFDSYMDFTACNRIPRTEAFKVYF